MAASRNHLDITVIRHAATTPASGHGKRLACGPSGRVGPAGPWAHATGLDRNELGALLAAAGLGRRRNMR